MKFARKQFGWLIIFALLAEVRVSADESELKTAQDGLLANAECWKRYDVFITVECIVPERKDDANRKLYEAEEQRSFSKSVRLAIDHESDEVFMFSKLDLRDIPADCELRPSENGIVSVSQLIWTKGGRVHNVSFPGGQHDNDGAASYLEVMRSSVALDLRCVGLGGIGASFGKVGSFQRALLGRARRWNSPDEREIVSESNEEVQFTRSGKTRIVATQRFAKENMMPIQLTVKEAIGDDNVTLMDELYAWREFDGVFVPESVNSEETQLMTDERRISVFQSLEAHWMSFGEPIDPKLFELAERKEYSKLLKCIDPVSLGLEQR